MYENSEEIRLLSLHCDYQVAVFDFDGTVSLIRSGWQEIMISYFLEELLPAPDAQEADQERRSVKAFIDRLTGKQTIYQCMELAEQIRKRGGNPKDPLEYKEEYLNRLGKRIDSRVDALRLKTASPRDWVVPGSHEFLAALRKRGLTLYLVSGTDEQSVISEADHLEVASFFNGGIFGAPEQYQDFSKAKVIEQILQKHCLNGNRLLGFGDGIVETENVKSGGGTAVGVAFDEVRLMGIDPGKRQNLLDAGADLVVADFQNCQKLLNLLFPKES